MPRSAEFHEPAPAGADGNARPTTVRPGVLVAKHPEAAQKLNALQTDSILAQASPGCHQAPCGLVCLRSKTLVNAPLRVRLDAWSEAPLWGASVDPNVLTNR